MAISLRKRKRESSVPTDSLSDIAFLLIIFFILTTSIRRLTGFTTDMPSAQKSPPQTQQTEKTPTVTLVGGQLKMDGAAIEMPGLQQKLGGLNLPARKESDRVVILETSGKVVYQQYYEVLAAISGAGGIVGILTEDEGKKTK
jgi:biopolymer transport protein ExbD